MRKRLLMLTLLLVFLGLAGCRGKNAQQESDKLDVVVISNTLAPAGAREEKEEDSAKTAKAETTSSEDADGYVYSFDFEEDSNYDLKDFIRRYYDYMVSGDYGLAAYMTNDSSRLDKELFMERSACIEAVKSLTCYIMDGMLEGTYIVVAKCGFLTTYGDGIVTMLEAFYVCTNESGTFYICGGGVADEVKSYNSIMLSSQEILYLTEQAKEDNDRLKVQNSEFDELDGIIICDGVFRYLYEQPVVSGN